MLLGQRVVAILETGARVATYKLATLMALIDHCMRTCLSTPKTRSQCRFQTLHIGYWNCIGARFNRSRVAGP